MDTQPRQGTSWQRWHCPPVPATAPSSAGTHKPVPCADPAGMKDSLATVVKSSYVSAALPEEDSSRETPGWA